MQKLRPLSVVLQHGAATQDQDVSCASEGLEAAPQLPSFDVEVSEESSTPKGMLELWQRKLLDLTTRNRLLHLPESAKAIRLVCPDPGGLEDILADDKSVRIVPMPDIEVGHVVSPTADSASPLWAWSKMLTPWSMAACRSGIESSFSSRWVRAVWA